MAEKRIETVEMRAGDVKTGFGNPRKITKKKKDELRNSIETFGDFGSFIIDENDNIIGGNMRLSVIKEMDPDTIILCKRLIGYSETELRAINIKDNTHSGDWDMDLLADWTADLTVDLGLEKATKKEMEERSIPYEDLTLPMDIQTLEDTIKTEEDGRKSIQKLKVFCDYEILAEDEHKKQKADRVWFQGKWFECLSSRLSENTPLRHWTATFVQCLDAEDGPKQEGE